MKNSSLALVTIACICMATFLHGQTSMQFAPEDFAQVKRGNAQRSINTSFPEGSQSALISYWENSNNDANITWNVNSLFNGNFMLNYIGVHHQTLLDVQGRTYDPTKYYTKIDSIGLYMRVSKASPNSVTDTVIVTVKDPLTKAVIWTEYMEFTKSYGPANGDYPATFVYPKDLIVCSSSFDVEYTFHGPIQDSLQVLTGFVSAPPNNCGYTTAGGWPCGTDLSVVPYNTYYKFWNNGLPAEPFISHNDCNNNFRADPCEYFIIKDLTMDTYVTFIDKPLEYNTTATPDYGLSSGTASVDIVDDVPVTYAWTSLTGINTNLPGKSSLSSLTADKLLLGIAIDGGYKCEGEMFTDTVEIKSSVSIEDFSEAGINSFDIYPNPTQGQVSLSITLSQPDDISIEVRDIHGRLLYEADEQKSSQTSRFMDLSELSSGVYIINVVTSNGIATKRVLLN